MRVSGLQPTYINSVSETDAVECGAHGDLPREWLITKEDRDSVVQDGLGNTGISSVVSMELQMQMQPDVEFGSDGPQQAVIPN